MQLNLKVTDLVNLHMKQILWPNWWASGPYGHTVLPSFAYFCFDLARGLYFFMLITAEYVIHKLTNVKMEKYYWHFNICWQTNTISKSFFIFHYSFCISTVKPVLSDPSKNGFQDRLWLNAGQKYCRMHQGEHPAIFSTFIKLPFVIKIFVLSNFEWPLKTDFIVVELSSAA